MAESLYQASVAPCLPMLTTLSGVMTKAAADAEGRKIDPAVLLQSRLCPDMLPLLSQGQIATHMTSLTVTTIRERPDLLPVMAEWMWHQWWRQKGYTLEQTQVIYAECVADTGAPQTFVLLEGDRPVGTVTLARKDMEERPDLTPWLAGVFVVPDRRGRGYFQLMLAEFEKACRTASIETAWLFTNTAERVYLKTGWETAETIHRADGEAFTLMRRAIPSKA